MLSDPTFFTQVLDYYNYPTIAPGMRLDTLFIHHQKVPLERINDSQLMPLCKERTTVS